MELQDDGVTLGLENSISKDIISIINNVFQAPWGGSHTCQKDEKAVECGLCQSSILCYQLGFELLEQLAPKEEIRLVVSRAGKRLYYWCAKKLLHYSHSIVLKGAKLHWLLKLRIREFKAKCHWTLKFPKFKLIQRPQRRWQYSPTMNSSPVNIDVLFHFGSASLQSYCVSNKMWNVNT